jgi:sigma-E factor negative regulatory protein RseC
VFPIIAMIVGAFVGQYLAPNFNADPSFLSAIFGFLFFGITILFVKVRGNKMAKKDEYRPKIIRVIGQS